MDKPDIKRRILNDPDYIHSPKFSNSVEELLVKHSDGIEDAVIAKLLLMTPEEVEKYYLEAVKELREEMGEE